VLRKKQAQTVRHSAFAFPLLRNFLPKPSFSSKPQMNKEDCFYPIDKGARD
jgi:hypothetical protein